MNRCESIRNTLLAVGTGMVTKDYPFADVKLHLRTCVWSLKRRMSPADFDVVKTIGLQGVQVSYNTKNDETGLSNHSALEAIRQASLRTGMAVSSLAIAELNQVPCKSEPRTEAWVWNSVDAVKGLEMKVVLLAFSARVICETTQRVRRWSSSGLKKWSPTPKNRTLFLASNRVTRNTYEDLESYQTDSFMGDWNIYSPIYAPVSVAYAPNGSENTNKCLRLTVRDPHDFAKV